MKTCHKCRDEKALDDFPKNRSRDDGHSETCLECKRKYNRAHYAANKQYYMDKAWKCKDGLRMWLRQYKYDRGCSRCPENHPACLHFHHRDPEQKLFEICDAVLTRSKKAILLEIEKCDVVCANCHAKIHFEKSGIQWPGGCDGSTQPSEG